MGIMGNKGSYICPLAVEIRQTKWLLAEIQPPPKYSPSRSTHTLHRTSVGTDLKELGVSCRNV